ncbi:hypothetical protein I4U23_021998 [Adineta vaga]|nr:hypothetical protein I4U23_021998 [Adineta vaga]
MSNLVMQLYLLILIFSLNLSIINAAKYKNKSLNSVEAQKIAIDVYVYGYSLITSEITRVQMTNVDEAKNLKAPMGQFINARHYPPANYRGVTTPNADTLYSLAWLDLDNEPWIFSHPDMANRYYLFPMYDLWTSVIESPGKRTAGTTAATYIITGPKWKGKLPLTLRKRFTKHIKSSTRYLLILGRTYCTGTAEDYTAVHHLQDQYLLKPFSDFVNNRNRTFQPKIDLNPGFSMTDDVRTVINNMNISTYFNMMMKLLKDNPPLKQDRHIIKKMAKLDLFPGQIFNWNKFGDRIQVALNQVPKLAFNKISSLQNKSGTIQNGWLIPEAAGRYGTDYLRRAYIAAYGWGANLREDAIYPHTTVDSNGKKLSGENKYVIHFTKDQTPPVNAFWSITMYDQDYFFVPNPLNKFTLSPRDPLIYNSKDGSLDLYFQHTSPELNKQNNWLPAPNGSFILMLRMYWPKVWIHSINNISWEIPPVKQML